MGEFKIRDTNDEINKLLNEKSNWEDQIIALGGPDYKVFFKNYFLLNIKIQITIDYKIKYFLILLLFLLLQYWIIEIRTKIVG